MLKLMLHRILPAALFLALSASQAAAQGMFYREVEKEGRLYVFNIMKEFAQWEKSGEMGKSITRIGFGPNRETVIFDSEEAINAFLFKHGMPGEVILKPEEKKPVQKFSWKDGKLTFETDLFKVDWANRIQVRYTLVDPEKEDTDSIGSFRIRRAKMKLSGWFYNKNLEFETQYVLSANQLEDANLNWVIGKDRSIMLKAGSFKVPFGRQELTSSGSQQFVDRSLVSGEFARGRDIGVQLWGEALDKKLDWRVGIFNGAGFLASANDNKEYQLTGRLQFAPNGDPKYSESDFDSSTTPLFAVAANFDINDLRPGSMDTGVKRENFGADGTFKYKGFSLFAEAYFGTRTKVDESETDVQGFAGQAGYFVVKQKFELAARYALLDLDKDKDDNERTEIGAALSYYYNKHNLKWQTDVRQLEDKGRSEGDRKTLEIRSQLQFIF